MNDVKTTLDILFLEKDFAKDCKCQASHDNNSVKCSVTVTHRHVSCTFDVLTCTNATERVIEKGKYGIRHDVRCITCHRNLGDCWSIRPV